MKYEAVTNILETNNLNWNLRLYLCTYAVTP